MKSRSCCDITVLCLRRRLEQDCWELTAQITLPHACILRRNQIDFVNQQHNFLALFDCLVFNLFVPAPLRVPRIKHLNKHICRFHNLLQLLVIRTSALRHLSGLWVVNFASFYHEVGCIFNLLISQAALLGFFLEALNFGIHIGRVVLQCADRQGPGGIAKLFELLLHLLVHVHLAFHGIKHFLLERCQVGNAWSHLRSLRREANLTELFALLFDLTVVFFHFSVDAVLLAEGYALGGLFRVLLCHFIVLLEC